MNRICEFAKINCFVPIVCQSCEDPLCIKVCPINARIKESSGAVITDEAICIGCRMCKYACPSGAPIILPNSGKSMTCDLCADDKSGPWCVSSCESKALVFEDLGKSGLKRAREYSKRMSKRGNNSLHGATNK